MRVRAAARSEAVYGVGPYESYLDPDTGERCLTDGVTAMMFRGPNGGTNRIVQSPGFVTILHEEFRDRRIISVDGARAWHDPPVVRGRRRALGRRYAGRRDDAVHRPNQL